MLYNILNKSDFTLFLLFPSYVNTIFRVSQNETERTTRNL